MRKLQSSTTSAFSLNQQYVPAVCAARAAASLEDDDDDQEEAEPARAAKRKGAPNTGGSSEWNYASVRQSFITKTRLEQGVPYVKAKSLWDQSEDKRLYLKDVSVQELKRRKFIDKGATQNPWSDH